MKYCTVCNNKYEDAVSFCPRDGEVLDDDPSSLVDQTLDGQYQIEALLGRGGMGAVYRANHILLGDRVAIKVLPPQMRNNAEWLRRFRREGQAARRFRHPNAVTVYDLRTTADGLIYMVMEYVEGHTLDAELKKRGRFTPLEAMSVLEPVMSVLNAAHAMGVVHRDLKPENIMLGKSADPSRPVVKLLDLGIAKMIEVAGSQTGGGATALTIAGQILGTPYYMSPEQWGEVPRDGLTEIDGRADIYSLGTVFHELIVGRKPFQANTLQELRRQHVSAATPPLHELMKEVPEAFSLTIARAMSKDRGDRPATAGEFDAELRVALGLPAADINTLAFASTGSGSLDPQSRAQTNTGIESASSDAAINSHTGSAPEGRNTSSDISAATVVTVDQEPWDATSAGASRPQSSRPSQKPPDTLTVAARDATPEQSSASSQSVAGSQPDIASQPDTGSQVSGDPLQRTIATHPSALSGVGRGAQPAASGSFSNSSAAAVSGSLVNAPAAASLAAPAQRRSPVPIIIAVALLLLLAVGGIGGFLVYKRMSAGEAKDNTNGPGKRAGTGGINGAGSSNSSAPDEAASAPEMMRYWVDVESAGGAQRLAGDLTLHSGQRFRFHLVPQEDGYVYIIGPGEKSVPTTFLTAKPIVQYGKTNEVKSGADFVFPSVGSSQWLQEDQTTGQENYTIIFSPTPLSSPGFLNAPANHALTSAEQAEWQAFRDQHKANSPTTNVNAEGGVEPFISVKMSGQSAANNPAILDVRIEHQ